MPTPISYLHRVFPPGYQQGTQSTGRGKHNTEQEVCASPMQRSTEHTLLNTNELMLCVSIHCVLHFLTTF